MIVYPDTSVLLAALIDDDLTEVARPWLAERPRLSLSAWTAAEFTSGIRLKVRKLELTEDQARRAEHLFDGLIPAPGLPEPLTNADVVEARRLVAAAEALRAPDALHIAVADRLGHAFVTLDKAQKAAAIARGLSVVDL